MPERVIIGGITYQCEITDNGIALTGFEGGNARISRVIIPDVIIDSRPELKLTCIGKKAFLGAKSLIEVSLPSTVNTFEDWAFSGCSSLKNVVIRAGKDVSPTFGKGVFDNCPALENIMLGYEIPDAMSILLSAVTGKLPAAYLFLDPELGHDTWYSKWDMALVNYLNQKDDEGYTNRVLCGEEDISYDGIGSVDGELLSDGVNYYAETRKTKCYLCLLRLMYDYCLDADYRKKFTDYVIEHGKGQATEEAWMVLKDELKGKIEFLKLFSEIGGISVDRVDEMLDDLKEEYAEGKAFLIRYKQEHSLSSDFFDGLLL